MLIRQVTTRITSRQVQRCLSSASPWADYAMAPPDPIIGLGDAFRADDFPQKVIVGVGAYRDDLGKPCVLPCVREAEKIIQDQLLDHEYSGIVSNLCTLLWGMLAHSTKPFRSHIQ